MGFFLSAIMSLLSCYLPNLSYCIHSLPFPHFLLRFRLFFCFPLTAHACRHVWTVNNRGTFYALTKVTCWKRNFSLLSGAKRWRRTSVVFYQVDKKKKKLCDAGQSKVIKHCTFGLLTFLLTSVKLYHLVYVRLKYSLSFLIWSKWFDFLM